ncbi:hypothetical protein EHQ12_04855 [Leptospira gomenensis]|uniref:Prenyltransferase n=1 Tax=Leptospira gomenensis TaxID=2484974 RepID=A0A5F1YI75_9LEPT|nr:hypothetical protein [Leptospira gomenensis]TGK34707.1 hypothetical protein EHQ17_08920 [Leptospira gomenensis]TGK40216.1 hypothetical protein EHQ07_18980 [Leptospira gomenensis]TGK42687.1 hypothetical protein EHQ12_04855 [Leptospira gomenensis]TGK55723.1 hypothetical protein EHQ13_17205 [Leptospira gomenensis]
MRKKKYATNELFRYWNVLSLDIVAGSLSSVWFVSTLLGSDLRTVYWFLLPASVWVIYTADHLLDGWRSGNESANVRHEFHYKNRIFLSIIACLSAIFCLIGGIMFLREWVVLVALILGTFALIHVILAFVQPVFFWKECSVSVLYTAGIWFGPILTGRLEFSRILEPCFCFLLTALCNSFMNSYMEREIDRKENMESILKTISPTALKRCVFTLAVIGTILDAFWLFRSGWSVWPESVYFCVGYLVPVAILLGESRFQNSQRFRILGEGYFILAVIPTLIRKSFPF